MIQSIHFSKKLFTLSETRQWLKHYGLVPMKAVHETDNFYEYRMNPPYKGRYYSKYVQVGVLFIFVRK